MDWIVTKRVLDWCQERVNYFYWRHGLTDKVLEFQIRINRIRSKLDLEDEDNIVTDDGYVQ